LATSSIEKAQADEVNMVINTAALSKRTLIIRDPMEKFLSDTLSPLRALNSLTVTILREVSGFRQLEQSMVQPLMNRLSATGYKDINSLKLRLWKLVL
jgi:hypothetical protein